MKDIDVNITKGQLKEIINEVQKTNQWVDACSSASMWSQIFQIAGLVLLALILWRVW